MPALDRRTVLIAFMAAGLPAGLPAGARAAADPAPLAPVQALIGALQDIMRQGRTVPFPTRAATLTPVIEQAFDLNAILRASVGTEYASIDPAQLPALATAFRDYTVASYVHSFDEYNGQRFEVRPDTRAVANGAQVVTTRIIPTGGEPHELGYVMREQNGRWRVVDVLADGSISRVAVQRSDFRRLLAQGGAGALIASLQAKARDLATP
jgi:phospholipid transport system substrate-binding protein